ncbi:MAG: tyrosine-type recombinase/integrase [Actinomycetota bacterium]
MLRAHRKRQLEERLAAGEVWHSTGYVFTDLFGRPIHPDVLYRQLKAEVERLGLPWIGVKGLRHTWATVARRAARLPLDVIQDQLRHSSVRVTKDVYVHLVPGARREATEAVAQALREASVGNGAEGLPSSGEHE